MSTTLESCVNLQNNVFEYLSSAQNGGAICINRDSTRLEVLFSVFLHCTVPHQYGCNGGAIYYNSKNQRFIGRKLCAEHCTGYMESFIFVSSDDNDEIEGGLNQTCYQYCSDSSSPSYDRSVFINSGIYDGYYINATNDMSSNDIVIGFYGCKKSSSGFGMYVNNTFSALFCFWLTKSEPLLKNSVYISNKMNSNILRLIHYHAERESQLTVRECIFFKNDNYLFSIENAASISVINCTMDICNSVPNL